MQLMIITFATFLLLAKCTPKSYNDHLLIHGYPKSYAELDLFKKLDKFYSATYWKMPSLVYKSVEFSLSRSKYAELVNDTKDMDIDFIIAIRDLQSAFVNQTIKAYTRKRLESFDWRSYYRVEDIYNWLRDLNASYPKEVHVESIGRSVQKRHILAVTVQLQSKNKNRSTIVIEGGCHAREWISPAFVTYMINTILNAKNSTRVELKQIARSYIWIFIPLLNPDGYSYSQTTDRLWKNNYHGSYGVDLNRNFDIAFGKFDASKNDKSSRVYCGEVPFSEPETSALESFLTKKCKNQTEKVEYYLAFHSYGQYIYIPYTYEQQRVDNYIEVKKYADKVAERAAQKYEAFYHVGNFYEMKGYLASGLSTDWVKKTFNVPYVVKIDLPDTGAFGFALPPDRILPTCMATMDSILPFLAPKAPKEHSRSKMPTKLSLLSKNGVKRHKSYIILRFIVLSIVLIT